ncbi:MAG TPA: neocarzinostatin apoprotein domain-containing protein [Acidimicrobiales bacterium]|nr:neocarzinostatin apoprotein domain-containing protein [Acidimicrobiales bacterium]
MSLVERRSGSRLVFAALALTSSLAVAAVATDAAQAATEQAQRVHAVGISTETYIDTHRPTAAWGPTAAAPTRTLVTTILYPAQGSSSSGSPLAGAIPDRRGGPYPLIVFAHGLGADPELYLSLLSSWAAAGFVVAAPIFPLTGNDTPGGPDAGDVINQPGDMSFVITSVLRTSAQPGGPLSGLIDRQEIGAAGHSNGAITTLGLVADTCCHDHRVKAAVVMAGTTEAFPGGHFDLVQAPPLLLIHGTADALVPYSGAVAVFNAARGPKGLLSIKGGDHGSAAGLTASSAGVVQRTTTDFFEAYLRGDRAAQAGITTVGHSGVTTEHFDTNPGSRTTITTLPSPRLHLRASATPTTNLTNGATLTITWTGYTAGKVVNILECNASDLHLNSSAACSFAHADILTPDPTGQGHVRLEIVEGAVGNGICDTTHPSCFVVVNNASSTAPNASVKIPISFAP